MRDAPAGGPDEQSGEARSHGEPQPFDPSMSRYAPERPFPPYRHLPGETPHPRKHLRGHSHGIPDICESPPLSALKWYTNAAYLYGRDPGRILRARSRIDRVTARMIRSAARKYLDLDRTAEVFLVPEGWGQSAWSPVEQEAPQQAVGAAQGQ